ncbi:MAG: hypothetical protein Q9221_002647 [Calogaya cf. arnoldii]
MHPVAPQTILPNIFFISYLQPTTLPNMLTSTVLSIAIFLIPNTVSAHEGHPHQLEKRATLNGPCTGAGGAPGVCISTTSCTADGGTHILNACPGKAVFRDETRLASPTMSDAAPKLHAAAVETVVSPTLALLGEPLQGCARAPRNSSAVSLGPPPPVASQLLVSPPWAHARLLL